MRRSRVRSFFVGVAVVFAALAGAVAPVSAFPTWGSSTDLSQSGAYPSLAVSADGSSAVAAWIGDLSVDDDIVVAAGSISGNTATWGTAATLDTGGEAPQVVVSADGSTAMVVWTTLGGSGRVRAAVGTLDGSGGATWGPVSDLTSPGTVDNVRVVISADGTRATAVWIEASGGDDIVRSASATISGATATWGSASDLSAPGADADYPRVAMSLDGTRATAVWIRSESAYDVTQTASAAISGSSATWSGVVNLSASSNYATYPKVSVSADGSVAVAAWSWGSSNVERRIQVASATVAGSSATWGAAVTASAGSGFDHEAVEIGMSADGSTVVAVWEAMVIATSETSIEGAVGSVSGSSSTWGASAVLSPTGINAFSPYLAVSGDGSAVAAVWNARNANFEFALQSSVGAVAGSSATWATPTVVGAFGPYLGELRVGVAYDVSAATAVWDQGGVIKTVSGGNAVRRPYVLPITLPGADDGEDAVTPAYTG